MHPVLTVTGINITDDGELVGDTDGSNFGVGVAPHGSRPAASSIVNNKKKGQKKGQGKVDRVRY